MGLDLLTVNDPSGRYAPSWYAATADIPPPAPALQGSQTADVAVIGGGFTGLSAALHLAEAGYDVVLLEAHRIGWGASGRNGGQLGSGQRRAQSWIEAQAGQAAAQTFWNLAEEAKSLVRQRIAQHKIDCALQPGIIYAGHTPGEAQALQDEAAALHRDYGYDALEPLDRDALKAAIGTDTYHGGVRDKGAGHLHPLRLALGLARAARAAGVRLFEETRVARVETGVRPVVHTGKGAVRASKVLLACNGYIGNLQPRVSARIMPINNFVIATEPLGAARGSALIPGREAVADTRFVVNYYRLTADNRMLFGGGETYGYRFPRDIAPRVRGAMLKLYPDLADLAIDYAWGGTLGITVNRMPAFQRLGPNILSAGGYSGHGVALAHLAGKLMVEAVSGDPERFDLFAELPQPAFPGGGALRAPLLAMAMAYYRFRDLW
ncbi:MAG: FAD-binding oxidoreductase [Pseudomonadota bacterium]